MVLPVVTSTGKVSLIFFLEGMQRFSPLLQNTLFVFRMKLIQSALFLLKQNSGSFFYVGWIPVGSVNLL